MGRDMRIVWLETVDMFVGGVMVLVGPIYVIKTYSYDIEGLVM